MNTQDDFENRLKSLIPARSSANAVAAAFEAGRRSGRRQTRAWQLTTFALALLAIAWVARPVNLNRPSQSPMTASTISPIAYSDEGELSLQRAVLDHGIDALPPAHTMTMQMSNPSNPL
jgi:hypothetical protein